jgi:hypothetical protein
MSDTPAPLPREEPRNVGGIEWFAVRGRHDEECQCARCGSSCAFLRCGNCGGDDEALGSSCIDDLCHGGECIHGDSGFIRCDWCHGAGGWWHCCSGPAWCEANPLPGREHITSTALRADAWND